MADVFSGLAADFDELIQGLGNELLAGFNERVRPAATRKIVDGPPKMQNKDTQREELVLQNYAESLASHHRLSIKPNLIRNLIREVTRPEDWLNDVDSYRPVFAAVTKKMDGLLEVSTSMDEAHDLRIRALDNSRREETLDHDSSTASPNRPEPRCEKFLDAEIIAIYW